MRTKDLENYIIAMNMQSQKILILIQDEIKQLIPTKDVVETTIEYHIKKLQDKIGIDYIKTLAQKYNVVIFEDLYLFLTEIQDFDKRDTILRSEVKALDRKTYKESKNRLNTIRIAKYFREENVSIKTKRYPTIESKNKEYNYYISDQILKKLFRENKDLYCSELKWNEEKNIIEDNEIDMLVEVEKKMIETYELLDADNEREIAIEIKKLAKLLHEIDFMNDILNNEDDHFNPKIKQEYNDTWANTEKSCFIVDLLVYFNVLKPYFKDKTPQEKYQYIKSKLKQANSFLSKVQTIY